MERDHQVIAPRAASSIPVPNVQALAASYNGSSEIPEAYVRPEAWVDQVASNSDVVELPIIDFSRLLDPQSYQEESVRLEIACEEWGFFQLINHGICEEIVNEMKTNAEQFFKLPPEEKKACVQLPNGLEGYGQAFVVSENQKLDWADMFYLITRPPASRDMRFWPTHPPTFRDTLDRYSSALKEVACTLLRLMARNLGLEPEILLSYFTEQPQAMRMNYYPPCPKADMVLGLSPHTDATGLTLLLQVGDVQGLQIKKDGKWLPIEPLPSAFIVNIGDALEIVSNGKMRSIEHRAVIDTKNERLSIAAFHDPRSDAVLGPIAELVKGADGNYKNISYKEYMQAFLSSKLEGRSLLESMKLK